MFNYSSATIRKETCLTARIWIACSTTTICRTATTTSQLIVEHPGFVLPTFSANKLQLRWFSKLFDTQLFFGVPHLATCIFLIFYNGPELGAEINPGMALTPLPSSIGRGSNPRPSNREPSALPLDHSFR